jgi:hypothetical protein
MKRHAALLVTMLALNLPAPAGAQTPLPLVEDVKLETLRPHCRHLLQALENLQAPLAADTEQALKKLLQAAPGNDDGTAEAIQKALDRHCLIGVTINPESRVKAARGPAPAELRLGKAVVVLVKVQNDAGVTHPLRVSGPQVRARRKPDGAQWLDAQVHAEPPLGKKLSGEKLEYVVLRLTAHEAGKREATLQFDVGQGTQDIGFRAEVPVLFDVRAARQ